MPEHETAQQIGPEAATRVMRLGARPISALSAWTLVVWGYLAAEFATYIVCDLPDMHHRRPLQLVLRAAGYVAVSAGSGVLGVLAPPHLLHRPAQVPTRLLVRLVGLPWVFFPSVALFYQARSLWMLPASALVVLLAARGLYRVSTIGLRPRARPVHPGLGSLFGTPHEDSYAGTSALMAISAVGAAGLAANGDIGLASLCVAPFLLLAVWRWKTLMGRHLRSLMGDRTAAGGVSGGFAACLFAMVLWSAMGGVAHDPAGKGGLHGSAAVPGSKPNDMATSDAGYLGIILLPPPKKPEKKIVAPPTKSDRTQFSSKAKPLIIPFDGPYWYFKAPNLAPGRRAHVAVGKATDVNVHSTDLRPVLMEARQELGTSIALDCCAGMDVAVVNADNRPGRIDMRVTLADLDEPNAPVLVLGQMPLITSEETQIASQRPPAHEVLHFTIPPHGPIAHFSEIRIAFVPAPNHARAAPRVGIETFTLVPR